jgi:hypothetical protein
MVMRRLDIDVMCLGLELRVHIALRKLAIIMESSLKGPGGR